MHMNYMVSQGIIYPPLLTKTLALPVDYSVYSVVLHYSGGLMSRTGLA